MSKKVHKFDWDEANFHKCQKHGVSITEIEFVFANAPKVFPDLKHSETESRYLAIGTSEDGRFILIAFTYRSKGRYRYIRPISVRYMNKKEINHYKKYE